MSYSVATGKPVVRIQDAVCFYDWGENCECIKCTTSQPKFKEFMELVKRLAGPDWENLTIAHADSVWRKMLDAYPLLREFYPTKKMEPAARQCSMKKRIIRTLTAALGGALCGARTAKGQFFDDLVSCCKQAVIAIYDAIRLPDEPAYRDITQLFYVRPYSSEPVHVEDVRRHDEKVHMPVYNVAYQIFKKQSDTRDAQARFNLRQWELRHYGR